MTQYRVDVANDKGQYLWSAGTYYDEHRAIERAKKQAKHGQAAVINLDLFQTIATFKNEAK